MGYIEDGIYGQLLNGATPGPQNNQSTSVFQTWLNMGSFTGAASAFDGVWANSSVINDLLEDGKLNSAPAPFNNLQILDPEDIG